MKISVFHLNPLHIHIGMKLGSLEFLLLNFTVLSFGIIFDSAVRFDKQMRIYSFAPCQVQLQLHFFILLFHQLLAPSYQFEILIANTYPLLHHDWTPTLTLFFQSFTLVQKSHKKSHRHKGLAHKRNSNLQTKISYLLKILVKKNFFLIPPPLFFSCGSKTHNKNPPIRDIRECHRLLSSPSTALHVLIHKGQHFPQRCDHKRTLNQKIDYMQLWQCCAHPFDVTNVAFSMGE